SWLSFGLRLTQCFMLITWLFSVRRSMRAAVRRSFFKNEGHSLKPKFRIPDMVAGESVRFFKESTAQRPQNAGEDVSLESRYWFGSAPGTTPLRPWIDAVS